MNVPQEAHVASDEEVVAGEAWITRLLEAAAPMIAAAERDRIRKLAAAHDAACSHGWFADLIGDDTP